MKQVGLIISHKTPQETIQSIIYADKKGIETAWAISGGVAPDLLTYYAAAAVQTKQIKFGTSIVPILPRHPTTLIAQAIVLENLAPGRLRLGIGPSHKQSMEQVLGLNFEHPQDKLEEYVHVLRQALWEGKIDFSGAYYSIHNLSLPQHVRPPKTPILISALREKAFTLAGEIADGAISWMCPIEYLIETAKPAIKKGAQNKKRTQPPLIAHVPVAYSSAIDKILAASHKQLGRYGKMPFYASMFADAGFPVGTNGELSDNLIKNLVVYGTTSQIREKLTQIMNQGIDELLLLPITITDQLQEEKEIIDAICA